MANLRIKDQSTNLILSNGLIQATTETPTDKLRVGDSISQIGVKDGKLCVNGQSNPIFNAGIRDKFGVPITEDGTVTSAKKFLETVRSDSSNPNLDIYPVTDYIVRYKLDGSDKNIYPQNGIQYVDGVACSDEIASNFDDSLLQHYIIPDGERQKFDGAENGLTILTWIKTTTIIEDDGKGILAVGTAGASNNGFITRLSNDNKFQLTSNGNFALKSTTTVNTGDWFFCAATYDGTTGKIYVDGVLEDTEIFTFNTITGATNGAIGSNSNGNGTFFRNGQIDDVVYFNRVLSVDEMNSIRAFKCK